MDIKKIFLLPGEMHVARNPVEIGTLLGSCVAVCLYNRVHNFGGMNHFMLPEVSSQDTPSGKYGTYSTATLIKMILTYDNAIGHLEASIIGGGNVNGHLEMAQGIGASNILAAETILQGHNIPIINKSTGGDFGRKVYFKNWSGEIEIKKIEKSAQARFIEEKKTAYKQEGIKVLIVDDSELVRKILVTALASDPEIRIVGQAEDPYQARELLLEHDPDVVCLDIIMPKMDGVTFLKKLLLYKPKPVIIISTLVQKGGAIREHCEKLGAVEVIDKEELGLYKDLEGVRNILVAKIKQASQTLVRQKTKEELA
jgi:chemotaxis receptor (MCP) glutamine deamidase CheD/CheY-like chemotaxis protein